jgi:serine-type D-Ala-D-Ala carboxypeptidase (penicillin-binding protein 5/6)
LISGLGVLLLLVAVVAVRAATVTVPQVSTKVTHASTVRLAGPAPRPAWPASGQAALTVDGVGSLGASGGDEPRPTASVAKVMTAYLILKHHPLGPNGTGFQITVTHADVQAELAGERMDQSSVGVAAGEQLNERQLLEALLIPSGDNIAQMLATYQSGSVPAFVDEMNREAHALGMLHTTYTDPSGFDATTVSTASDQLRVFQRAMGMRTFREIVSMPTATLPVVGTVTNYNPLIADGYVGKTGSDSAAGGCLAFVTHTIVGGRRLAVYGVVMGQGEGSVTSVILGAAGEAATTLVDSVRPAIRVKTVLPAHAHAIEVTGADGTQVAARTTSPLRVIGWGGQREQLAIRPHADGTSLPAGRLVGTAYLRGTLPIPARSPARTAIRTTAALGAPGIGWRLGHLF